MEPSGIPVVETQRLILRGPTGGDIEAWATYLAEPGDFRYIPWRKSNETTLQRAKRILDEIANRWETAPLSAMGWVFSRKADGQIIGLGGLEQLERTDDAEIEYRLGKPFWGQRYASEAAGAMARYALENTAWKRIVAYVVAENIASVRVAEGLGMSYQGEVNYLDLLGGATDIEIASPMTAVYAVAREDFVVPDAPYRVWHASID
jgi:RimJ/RimL family protein N-acetyltransferase